MKAIIVAEAASNHNGDMLLAKEMIHAAKESGADIIKFQSYLGKNVKDGHGDKERFSQMNLSDDNHYDLMAECSKVQIDFSTTCFDIERVVFLKSLNLKYIKIASYDVESRIMISKLMHICDHLILSTGSSNIDEVKKTVDLLEANSKEFTLLHCTTLYPTPLEKSNLARMLNLMSIAPRVGFSDHTLGVSVPKAAISMGASMVEKHFTLDKNLPGKSHPLACNPLELKEIADYAVDFEMMMGTGNDEFTDEEIKVKNFYNGLLGEGV
jgi:N,N'-diacetyllegionaminate synthase